MGRARIAWWAALGLGCLEACANLDGLTTGSHRVIPPPVDASSRGDARDGPVDAMQGSDAVDDFAPDAPVGDGGASEMEGGCAPGVIVGSQNQGVKDQFAVGAAQAFSYKAPSDGCVGSLAYLVGGGNSTVSVIDLGLYSDNAGHPDMLLGAAHFTDPVDQTWSKGMMAATVPVVAGKVYWIAVFSPQGTAGILGGFDENGTGTAAVLSAAGLTALPNPWASSPNTFMDGPLSAYAF